MSGNAAKLILNLLNVIIGVLLAAWGVVSCQGGTFRFVILGVCICVIGVLIVLLEIVFISFIAGQVPFYYSWLGRGLFYIFFGCVVLDNQVTLPLVTAIVSIAVGLLYCGMQCLHLLPFPYPIINSPAGGATTTTRSTTTTTTKTSSV